MSTKSQRVWESRRREARKLARMGDGDEEEALDLILRTIRFAMADAREQVRQNDDEAYARSRQAAHRDELLGRRLERLEAEWGAYGLTLQYYGLYPTVTTHRGGGDVIHLDYFD